jgi:hypothetical protein
LNVAVLVLVILQLLILVLLVGIVYQLFQQQGRLLLQVESLEQTIPEAVDAQDARPP